VAPSYILILIATLLDLETLDHQIGISLKSAI